MDLGEALRPTTSKRQNSEIVKALIILTQDSYKHKPGNDNPDLAPYTVTTDESNLVPRISMDLNAYRRQKDRMADVINQMKRIVSGD